MAQGLENIRPEAIERDERFGIVKKNRKPVLIGGLAKRWLDIQSPNLKPGCIERYDQYVRAWPLSSIASRPGPHTPGSIGLRWPY
jgi:hypothetical protein